MRLCVHAYKYHAQSAHHWPLCLIKCHLRQTCHSFVCVCVFALIHFQWFITNYLCCWFQRATSSQRVRRTIRTIQIKTNLLHFCTFAHTPISIKINWWNRLRVEGNGGWSSQYFCIKRTHECTHINTHPRESKAFVPHCIARRITNFAINFLHLLGRVTKIIHNGDP